MSEWKNRLEKSELEENFCTGWGIVDGLIACIQSVRKKRQAKKQINKTTNLKE